ncbi:MAG: hypothetical protein NXY57DRAFT_961709 [Lentinula lateritia]|uniref:Uncharacterized protein n=1 Tax=Lentinula lateritia TaxID=40482 RepID=A0ABQ8VBH1_9AGAR|nr:MAG: hypothetical protein NXY57DRAFT_961709 [Lentinula lateritia]KAJ4484500.1 hypothetical protein C8R41DRAFT_982388 [Lentinula lateritia]
MRVVTIWTVLTLCVVATVYAAPVGETHLQVPPRPSLFPANSTGSMISFSSIGSKESDISSKRVQVLVNDGTESYSHEVYVQIRVLVKAAAKAWGEKDFFDLTVEFFKPAKKSVERPSFPIAFHLIGDMTDCEPATNVKFPCVGQLDSMNPPKGLVMSLITMENYDTKKLNKIEKRQGQ